MTAPKTALMTVTGKRGPPSLSEAARQLGLSVADLNAGFGVVPIDPTHELYAVEVEASRIPAPNDAQTPYRGPFANPRIEAVGPVKKPDDGPDR